MYSAHYVYAIMGCDALLPADLRGLDDAPVKAIRWLDLVAATSPLNQAKLQPAPEHVLRHHALVDMLHRETPTLPVRFGTILADTGAVQRALADHYSVLLDDLARVGDKVELGLTVLWDSASESDQAGAEPAAKLIRESGPGTRYLGSRMIEHRRAALFRSKAKLLVQRVDDALKTHALESRCVTLPTPRLLMRAAYLLRPDGVSAFHEAFERVRPAYPQLRFLLSGPWPPYSFVTAPQVTPASSSDYGNLTRIDLCSRGDDSVRGVSNEPFAAPE